MAYQIVFKFETTISSFGYILLPPIRKKCRTDILQKKLSRFYFILINPHYTQPNHPETHAEEPPNRTTSIDPHPTLKTVAVAAPPMNHAFVPLS
jgi:hypothetical protein